MKEYTNKPKEQSSVAPPTVQIQTQVFAPPQVQQSPSPQTTESSQDEQDLESKKQQSFSQPTLYAPNPIFEGNGDHNSTKNVMQRKWEGIVQRVKEGRITEHDPSHTYTPMSGSPENVMQRKGLEIAQRLKENRTKQHQEKIQAKLAIGAVGDKYEQEADRVASQVVQKINSPQSVQRHEGEEEELQMKPAIASLQREAMPEEEEELQMKPAAGRILQGISSIQREPEEEEELQLKSLVQRQDTYDGGEASADLESSIQSARSSGQALDPNLQAKMGEAMGADFSGVKVHTDSQSDQLNKSIQAKAFTTGQDVFFRQGAYEPGSRSGQELIAHELTHVVQQNGGAVQRSPLSQNSVLVQRALLAKLPKEPSYSDGLDYNTIVTTALDKEPAPKKVGATWAGGDNRAARKTFKDVCGITDIADMDAAVTSDKLLQPGEIHGNTEYKNKSGDLPATTTYKEYDTVKYTGDPRLRGSDRIVVGADGKKYYTSDHYKNFAEFD